MITNNVELLRGLTKGDFTEEGIYSILVGCGFNGNMEMFYEGLLYALEETSVYNFSHADSEEEYFNIIARKMNEVL